MVQADREVVEIEPGFQLSVVVISIALFIFREHLKEIEDMLY